MAWLNSLPEVRLVVQREFAGKPVREQNLSEWKQGGYRDWLAQQEAREIAVRLGDDATAWQAEGRPAITDTLALWLAGRYAVATRRVAEATGEEGWQRLRDLCGDIVELRMGDHSAERLRIERERLELERDQSEERMREKLEAMLQDPATKDRGFGASTLTMEEKQQRLREIFGLSGEGCGTPSTGARQEGEHA